MNADRIVQLLVRAAIFFHLCGVLMPTVASFPNTNNSIDRSPVKGIANDPCLLPASSRVCLEFLEREETRNGHGTATEQQQPLLFLTRRDGVQLYGREILHTESDARAATMAFLSSNGSPNESLLWDATLVIQPDRERISEGMETVCQSAVDSPSSSISSSAATTTVTMPTMSSTRDSSSTCFVAMNRFRVKENCKSLFEDRWAQRQSKLSYQPGFLGFALLRRTRPPLKQQYYNDRFNYSTCTIWDSEAYWERWRSGTGKTSHEANREVGPKKRIPVSEWLEGPSAPIFWDGQRSMVHGSAMELFRHHEEQLSLQR